MNCACAASIAIATEFFNGMPVSIIFLLLYYCRDCQQYFERSKMSKNLKDILATGEIQAQAPFLALNFQSSLMNLTV